MTTTMLPAMRTPELMERLRRHCIAPGPLPGGVFVDEVAFSGRAGSSRADALFVGFTSNSGRILTGYEVKTSRSDWRKELDSPGKADAWADECHAFYVVAPSTEIVKPEELPDGWGLLVVNPRTKIRLDVKVKARSKGPAHSPSWDAMRSFLARADTLMWQQVNTIEREAGSKVRQSITLEVEKRERDRANSRTGQLEDLVKRLEDAIGCQITDYARRNRDSEDAVSVEHLAQAIKMVRAREPLFSRYRNLDQIVDSLDKLQGDLLALSLVDANHEAPAEVGDDE